MLYRFYLLFLLFFTIKSTNAQHKIDGIWEGKFLYENILELGQPKLVVEIFNVKPNGLFDGISHLYYEGNFYEHYKLIGMYDKKENLLVFKEVSTIAVDLGKYGNCLGKYNAVLKVEGKKMLQAGYWEPNIPLCTTNSNIWLVKKEPEQIVPVIKPKLTKPLPQTKQVKPVEKKLNPLQKKNAPVLVENNKTVAPISKPTIKTNPVIIPKKIAQRETDVQSLLEIAAKDEDSIRVDVYDNGDIDGDSVSVYQDNIQQIYKRLITAKPITFYVSLNKANPISHLRLVAENLGTIPPCTALMIVTTKSKRYEVRLSSNFSKNATVELFLKE
jgi:hypothetical protein